MKSAANLLASRILDRAVQLFDVNTGSDIWQQKRSGGSVRVEPGLNIDDLTSMHWVIDSIWLGVEMQLINDAIIITPESTGF